MEKLSHKNVKETEKFISETNKKDIEIKMEIPTAPEEEIDEIEIQEEEENPEQQSYEKIKEHNNKVMANWHAKCAMVGLLPKEFELLPEDKNIEEESKLEDENDQAPETETYKDAFIEEETESDDEN